MTGLMIRSWRMEWVGHVASMEKKRKAYRVLVVKPKEREQHLEELAVERMTELRWILTKRTGGHGLDSSGSEQGQVVSSRAHRN
jgi:hypothetical protein